MAEYRVRGIPDATMRLARARAADERTDISTVLITALTVYADRNESVARAGRASAAKLTPAERSQKATHAATARWDRVRAHSDGS